METAQPAKFDDAIRDALGIEPARPAELANLETLPQHTQVMDVDVEAVKRYIVEHS
jgi:threonine synthase